MADPAKADTGQHEEMEHHGAPHAMEGKEDSQPHVHPVATDQKAEVEEKLGAKIPLDLPFVDEDGRAVTLADLVDRPTIIAPVYYRCPNVCNFLQGGLADVLGKLDLKPDEYRVVSVSFDETETPKDARASEKIYRAAMHGAFPEQGWHFISGGKPEIDRLMDALGYRFFRVGVDFVHPVVVAVVNSDGTITRYLYGTRYLPMDVTLALMEAGEGKVGSTVRRLASLCFSYDPEKKGYVFNILQVSGVAVLLLAGGLFAALAFGGRKKRKH
ncbi:MAG: SCO family protein [Desulfuromonas sp.]|nr:MAG: SCO family protein [Desulfuromonas sp.]